MTVYYKIIDGERVDFPGYIKDDTAGVVYYNPTESLILAYGWIKEETGGADANARMLAETSAPEETPAYDPYVASFEQEPKKEETSGYEDPFASMRGEDQPPFEG